MTEGKKDGEHSYLESMLLVIFGIFTIFCSIIAFFFIPFLQKEPEINLNLLRSKDFWVPAFFLCLGLFINYLIIYIKNKIKGQKNDMAVHCEYQRCIKEMGILEIYPSRKKEESLYEKHLLNDFDNLDRKHKSKEKPIKMIGVALEIYFGNPEQSDLSKAIKDCCNNANFQVLYCDKKNEELKKRDMLLKQKNNSGKRNDKYRDLFRLIDDTDYHIKNITSSNEKANKNLKCYKYMFSPYATIIFLNNHIYYTPNVLEPGFYIDYQEPQNINKKVELSFCIYRDSYFGDKLEKQFDILWEDEKCNAKKKGKEISPDTTSGAISKQSNQNDPKENNNDFDSEQKYKKNFNILGLFRLFPQFKFLWK